MPCWPTRIPAATEAVPDRPHRESSSGLRVGVLGGGQLGRMLALAGIPLGLRFWFLDPAPDACSGPLGELITAGFDDVDRARELAGKVDLATFDFENVPESTARALEERCPLFPRSRALAASQDRLVEKDLLQKLGARVPAYHAVAGRTDLLEGLERLGYPAVLKTRRLGYDGKGQAVLRDPEDLERSWQRLGGSPLILESFVPFEVECSLVGVRGRDGETRFWPLTRNVHDAGILAMSLPGGFSGRLQSLAEATMTRLMDELDYVGVLTVEFFLSEEELLVNEFAPRVHNSGHWTIDGAECSQFENHLRAICGMPLGGTAMTGLSLMFNWIGRTPAASEALAIPGLHWHDYGKRPRPGRKLGHATLTATSLEELRSRAGRLASVAGGHARPLLEVIFDEESATH
jgi:5-(carboxyamino)imidazole ribonucleotide synthase